MEENSSSYIMKDEYASNGKANAALTTGIIGTALSSLGILGGGASLLGNNSSTSKNNMTTQDYVDITKNYYQQRIADLKELTNTFYSLDTKIQNNKDIAAAEARQNFDDLNKRIIDLEKATAVEQATSPLYQMINDLKLNQINQAAQNGIAAANSAAVNLVNMEAERRNCADNKIVSYVNSNFYPISVTDVSLGTTSTQRTPFNPLYPTLY